MQVSSLMLYAHNVNATSEFYRAIGVELASATPGRATGDVAGCRIAIVQASSGDAVAPGAGGTVMPGFEVESVDTAVGAVVGGGWRVLRQAETLEWGRRAVLADPDGRAVEVVERV